MALAKGDLGMCFEGLYHLSTAHLSDYCFCHFVSQIIIPDPQIIPHPILCFCFWPYPAMLFFLCWDTWPPWIFCLDSGWQEQIGLFCSVPHVKNPKCKRSILRSTQEISWFYWLNGVIYNTHVNGILFYFFSVYFWDFNLIATFLIFFPISDSPIYIFLLSFWFHGLSFHTWVLYTYVYLHIHIYS